MSVMLVFQFAGIDAEYRIDRAVPHECGYQRDGCNNQRHDAPSHGDGCCQTYDQQYDSHRDAKVAI
jgi:hypothetical protein